MSDRKRILVFGVLAVSLLALRHPTADIKIITHNVGDVRPHRMQAAIDLGIVGFSFLYTWTASRLH